MTQRYEESRLQQAIVTHFRRTYAGAIFHVGNGGSRRRLEGIRFKAEGVTAGVPDLVILTPGGRTYLVEVKAPAGTLSPQQRCFIRDLRDWLFDVAEVRSLDEAKRLFADVWGLEAKRAPVRSAAEMATGF